MPDTERKTITPETTTERMTVDQLATAFAEFSRASEELSGAYNALQGQAAQLSERLNVLMGALPAGVVVLDCQQRVVQVNRAARMLLGDIEEGQHWSQIALRLTPTETEGEAWCMPAGKSRRLSLIWAELASEEGQIVLCHDVTETHQMREQVERNERLAAMGEMVAGLAHQLRTPLAAALLYTSHLRQPSLSSEKRENIGERAVERLRYLERLIRDMLLFARGDSLGRQRFNICDLLTELAHTLEPLARARSLFFEVQCDTGTLNLYGDRKALGGALTNLLENAIQATPAGGRIALNAQMQQGQVEFRISDTGKGMDATQQTRVFEPFFTTRAEGTGLGLAIARGVARGHGGDIALQSTLGEGTCFTLYLPVTEVGTEAGNVPASAVQE